MHTNYREFFFSLLHIHKIKYVSNKTIFMCSNQANEMSRACGTYEVEGKCV
jgi:hypothetical protein